MEVIFPKFVETSFRYTDGEATDIIEHFFWGKKRGLVIELGAADGLPSSASNSYELEKQLGWKRILIEGNPKQFGVLRTKSSDALVVGAAICRSATSVHYATSTGLAGGILEMMDKDFLRIFYPSIYNVTIPQGNISSVNLTDPKIRGPIEVEIVPCVPMHTILKEARVQHVNVFILDTEGSELDILMTVKWEAVTFDVLCIETEERVRYPGYNKNLRQFLATKGYVNVTGIVGRNMWFTSQSFQPSGRPGLDPACYNRHQQRPRTGWERIMFWQKLEKKCLSTPYLY